MLKNSLRFPACFYTHCIPTHNFLHLPDGLFLMGTYFYLHILEVGP